MIKFLSVLICVSLFTNIAFANCDFSTVKENADGTFTYSLQQHICVGELKRDNKVKTEQIAKLTEGLKWKDIAIQKADERADRWMNLSYKLEDRVTTIDKMRSSNTTLSFLAGAGLTLLTVYVASKAIEAND